MKSFFEISIVPWLIRGFTGQEQLDEFALINMNGRIYDPVLGRFNSPDNEVQAPDYTQSLNRYSYAFNNPLRYTDPTGNVVNGGGSLGGGGTNNNPFGNNMSPNGNSGITYFVDGLQVSNAFGSSLLGFGGWGGNGSGGLSVGYAGNLTSIGIYGGDVVSPGGQVYGGADAINISNGLANGSLSYNVGTDQYGHYYTTETAAGHYPDNYTFLSAGTPYWHSQDGINYYGSDANYFVNQYQNANFANNILEATGTVNDFVDALAKVAMVNTGQIIGRVTLPVGLFIGAAQIKLAYNQDNNTFGYNTQKATAKFAGGLVGVWAGFQAGSYVGFETGFTVGLAFEGLGAIPGGVLGGIIGGFGGAFGGAYGGGQLGESLIMHK